ncbi:MAG TPA: GDCCVxC domain-containing (seleno)protein [Gaiellaceae bacterium]
MLRRFQAIVRWWRWDPAEVVVFTATLTCPDCGFAKSETMPTDACRHVYRCESCETVLKPLPGDCCVFCSYADQLCPPKQTAALNSHRA